MNQYFPSAYVRIAVLDPTSNYCCPFEAIFLKGGSRASISLWIESAKGMDLYEDLDFVDFALIPSTTDVSRKDIEYENVRGSLKWYSLLRYDINL